MLCACRQQLLLSLCVRSACPSVVSGIFGSVTRSGMYSSYGGIESSKHMQKLLTKKGAKNKRKWYQAHVAEPQELTGKRQQPNKHGVSEAQGHRARQLSHVLYVKICEIVNSGELDEEVLNKQVLISQVKMHPTFSGMNIYWDANRTDAAEIESMLDGLKGKLRSLLISYHVLGRIPNITFVKDRSKGDLVQLNQLLEVADYGPDYFPSTRDNQPHIMLGNDISVESSSSNLNTDKNLAQNPAALPLDLHQDLHNAQTCWNDNLKSSFLEAECQPDLNLSRFKIDVENSTKLSSSFRSNLYGLPRDDLMKKIVAKKKKAKYQTASEGQADAMSDTDSELRDYRKLRNLAIKDKERMLRQKDSTKVKQRFLEAEFDEIQDSLYERDNLTDDERENN